MHKDITPLTKSLQPTETKFYTTSKQPKIDKERVFEWVGRQSQYRVDKSGNTATNEVIVDIPKTAILGIGVLPEYAKMYDDKNNFEVRKRLEGMAKQLERPIYALESTN